MHYESSKFSDSFWGGETEMTITQKLFVLEQQITHQIVALENVLKTSFLNKFLLVVFLKALFSVLCFPSCIPLRTLIS